MNKVVLFLRDQKFNILAQLALVMLGAGIYMLERQRHANLIDLASMYYYIVLSCVCIVVWNIVQYILIKTYYQSLFEALQSEDALEAVYLMQGEVSKEQELVALLLRNQHKKYTDQLAELERKREIQHHFTLQWVHQMKTPLSVLDMQLQQVDEQIKRQQVKSLREQAELYQSMNEEVEKLNGGLELMLNSARLDKLELDLHIKPIALHSVIRDNINRYKKLLIQHSIFPKLVGEAHVASDQKWFGFIINQLITNAIKYSKLKQGRKELEILIHQQGEHTLISVRDQGIGIASSDLKRVFDPFFTGQNGRMTGESTGMGLYLAKEVCKRLGYTLSVSSVEGEGAEFTVAMKHSGIHLKVDE